MSKHAYLIIAYNKFEQLNFLLKLIDDYRNDIFILIDKKTQLTDVLRTNLYKSVKNSKLYIYNNKTVNWGDYSQIDAEMYLFKKSHEKSSYTYYHLLSGQDLPLCGQNTIHDFFDKNPDKIFLSIPSEKIYIKANISSRVKYNYKFIKYYGHSNLSKQTKRLFKVLEILNLQIQKIFGITKRKERSLPPIKYASNWLSLNNNAIEELLKNSEKIYKTFNNSFLCDELFVPTILLNNPEFSKTLYSSSRINDRPEDFQGNLRYINWWDGSPYVWKDNDIDKLKYARNRGHFFSRKFDIEKSPKLKSLIIDMCEEDNH